MNLLLLDKRVSSLFLPKDDPRTIHLLGVLKVREGDEIDLAVRNGPKGKGMVSLPGEGAIKLEIRWLESHPRDLHPVRLILGLARPQTCRKILEQASALGVERMAFFEADKGEPSYAQSSLWQTHEWMERIDRGIEQSFSSFIPSCTVYSSLEETLASERTARDPRKVALDNYESHEPLSAAGIERGSPVLLALGPERGWSAAERELLRSLNFEFRHLGERVLRLETAAVAALGIVLASYWGEDSESR